LTTKVNYKR